MNYQLRTAQLADKPALQILMERSVRILGGAFYKPSQLDVALQGTFGVDSQLIEDGTYFVAESAGKLLASGGWSYRKTLFGGDARADRDAGQLNPETDFAKIRAFFVDPDHVRQGLGRILLEHCESQARLRGFTRFEMMSTLPGVALYQAHGYQPQPMIQYPMGQSGFHLELVPMYKDTSRLAQE